MAVLLLARLALGVYEIELPGLQNDEAIFVNAATLQLPDVHMFATWHGVPTMVFPYSGALKSWLWTPLFAAFGTSVGVVRVPAVLLATVGLLLVHLGVRRLLGPAVALVALALLAFDGSVFWLTRNDVGPSAIEFLLKGALLLAVASWVARPRARTVALIVLLAALGVFNKLNFVWILNSLVVVSVALAAWRWRDLRAHRASIAVWVAGLAPVYATFAWWYGKHDLAHLNPPQTPDGVLAYTWGRFVPEMNHVLSGTWFHKYALAPLGPRTWLTVLLLVLVAAALAGAAIGRRGGHGQGHPRERAAVLLLGLAAALVCAQILLTPQATAGWHYVAVQPFVAVLAAAGAVRLASGLARHRPRVRAALLAGLAAAALVADGALLGRSLAAAGRQTREPAWTPQIYELSRYLRGVPGTVVTLDWGIFNPLLTLDNRDRYVEAAHMFRPPANAASLEILGASLGTLPEPKVFVAHGPGREHFVGVNGRVARAFAGRRRVLRRIRDPQGRVQFVVFRVVR